MPNKFFSFKTYPDTIHIIFNCQVREWSSWSGIEIGYGSFQYIGNYRAKRYPTIIDLSMNHIFADIMDMDLITINIEKEDK